MIVRTRLLACMAALALLPLSSVPAHAAPAQLALTDAIAPGVVRAAAGFGVARIVVPGGTYVTYLVQTNPALAGKTVQIWVRSAAGAWHPVTSRAVAADGSARYFARVSAWTAFQARFLGDATVAAGAAHGRIAVGSPAGDATLTVSCDEFQAQMSAGGTASLVRHLTVRAGAILRVRLCSNASTGYRWEAPHADGRYLALLGHQEIAPASGLIGAPGTEIWAFRALRAGGTAVTLAYSRPWQGGEKATWSLALQVGVVR